MKPKIFVAILILASSCAPQMARAQGVAAPPTAPTAAPPTAPTANEVAPPDPAVTDTFALMMGAISDDSYVAFLGPCSDAVRAALPKMAFEAVVAQIGPRLRNGFAPRFVDSVNHGAVSSYVWKIKFADGGDELMVLMTVRNEKVATFLLL